MNNIPGIWDYVFSLFPPDKISLIFLITAGVFAVTQAFKVVLKKFVGAVVLRTFAIASAFPIAMGIWPVKDYGSITAVALIGWYLAHLLAVYGMKILKEYAPRFYRTINGEPDRRKRNSGPRTKKGERRK